MMAGTFALVRPSLIEVRLWIAREDAGDHEDEQGG